MLLLHILLSAGTLTVGASGVERHGLPVRGSYCSRITIFLVECQPWEQSCVVPP